MHQPLLYVWSLSKDSTVPDNVLSELFMRPAPIHWTRSKNRGKRHSVIACQINVNSPNGVVACTNAGAIECSYERKSSPSGRNLSFRCSFPAVTLFMLVIDKVLRIQSQVRKREQHIVFDLNAKRSEKMVNAKYIYIYSYLMYLSRI